MWVLFARAAPTDSAYWPGRRWIAALDAVGWPTFWLTVLSHVPARAGLAGIVLMTLAVIVGVHRLHVALWRNHRYRFTTWRWGRLIFALVLVGMAMKYVHIQDVDLGRKCSLLAQCASDPSRSRNNGCGASSK